jgi:hypothetical protein
MFETIYGVFVGTITFWLWGFFTKGFAENVQSYYAKKWISALNLRGVVLRAKVAQSITKIDDLLLTTPLQVLAEIDKIVNNENVEQKILIDETYKLTKLLKKYHEKTSTFAGKLDERS